MTGPSSRGTKLHSCLIHTHTRKRTERERERERLLMKDSKQALFSGELWFLSDSPGGEMMAFVCISGPTKAEKESSGNPN